jgi:hypothetical protein
LVRTAELSTSRGICAALSCEERRNALCD